ncbi:T9SS type A sorting domain-containing protein [candidate division WOR-3 bacterium]|nr:T9SS type A sorting domain-containing protein [candidate division WOR-3 bacterium]
MKILKIEALLIALFGFAVPLLGWTEINVNDTLPVCDVQFLNDTVGYLTLDFDEVYEDSSRLYKTTDGGVNWNAIIFSDWCHQNCLYFYNENFGFAAGDIWEPADNPFYPLGTFGMIFKTENGGVQWDTFAWINSVEPVKRICIIDSIQCWTLTEHHICHTGNIFNPGVMPLQYTLTNGYFKNLFFHDSFNGYAVGMSNIAKGILYMTTNGGDNWIPNTILTGDIPPLRSIFFIDQNVGWAVGWYGCVYKTTDNGGSWNQQVSGVTDNLEDVYFFNENMGWIVGDDGTILYTDNGGVDWGSQNSGTNRDLKTVFFLDSLRGWVGGDSGTILCTQDGGTAVEEERVELTGSEFMMSLMPSNRTLNVSFHLNTDTHAEISVYNILGQGVFFMAQKKYSKGENSVEIDIADFPAGVYFTNFRTECWKVTETFFVIE